MSYDFIARAEERTILGFLERIERRARESGRKGPAIVSLSPSRFMALRRSTTFICRKKANSV